jgi:hypothetical protein
MPGGANFLSKEVPMPNLLRVINSGDQPERIDTIIRGFKTVIVLVRTEETKEQAWRSYLKEHPEDNNADVKIFNFVPKEKT